MDPQSSNQLPTEPILPQQPATPTAAPAPVVFQPVQPSQASPATPIVSAQPNTITAPSETPITQPNQLNPVPLPRISTPTTPVLPTQSLNSTPLPETMPANEIVNTTINEQPTQPEAAAQVEDTAPVAETPTVSADELKEAIANEPNFSWQASEFIHHTKGAAWYAILGLITLVLVAVSAYFQLWMGIALVLVMAAAIVVYAKKAPRTLSYSLDNKGITIESKHYPYSSFRSFSVFEDQEWHSIELDPAQRFMPRLTLLFSDEDIDEIEDHLSLHLPNNIRQLDLIERITRKVRF